MIMPGLQNLLGRLQVVLADGKLVLKLGECAFELDALLGLVYHLGTLGIEANLKAFQLLS